MAEQHEYEASDEKKVYLLKNRIEQLEIFEDGKLLITMSDEENGKIEEITMSFPSPADAEAWIYQNFPELKPQ